MSSGTTAVAVAGRYRLEKLIATGRTAEVWRARDLELSRTVVVKLVRAEVARDAAAMGRFRDNARLAASVEHQGIVRVFDYGEPDSPESELDSPESTDRPYLVMEFVDGPSLAEVLATGQHRPERALAVLTQASAALVAAHDAGLVHGELTARKILLAPGGVVKLIDFGCAGIATTTQEAAAADVFALGLLCHQCITGKLPSEPGELRVSTCPPALAELITKLTATDPALRLTSAAEVAEQAAALTPRQPPAPVHPDDSSQPAPAARTAVQSLAPMHGSTGVPRTPALLASPQPSSFWLEVSRQPRRFPTRTSAILAVALAVIAVVTAVKLDGVGPRAAGAVQPTMVRVDGAALTGQPVSAVRLRLHRLGLVVVLRWRPTDRVPPGRVLSVRPAGLVAAHSTVTVIGSRPVVSAQPGPKLGPRVSASPRSKSHRARQLRSPAPARSPAPSASPAPSSSPAASSPPPAGSPPPSEPAPSPSDAAGSTSPAPT